MLGKQAPKLEQDVAEGEGDPPVGGEDDGGHEGEGVDVGFEIGAGLHALVVELQPAEPQLSDNHDVP